MFRLGVTDLRGPNATSAHYLGINQKRGRRFCPTCRGVYYWSIWQHPEENANREMTRETNFAILIYEGVEPIDVGATHGILSMARRVVPEIRMCLVAERAGQVRLSNGLRVLADYGYADCPPAEVLVV